MKCVLCKVNEATVYFKQVAKGNSYEMNICESCAVKYGLILNPAADITDMIFGQTAKTEGRDKGKSCPACGLSASAFAAKSRLGCSVCYATFHKELVSILENVQKGDSHCGKIPKTAGVYGKVERLEKDLALAVENENFEDAARIRDSIKELKKTSGAK